MTASRTTSADADDACSRRGRRSGPRAVSQRTRDPAAPGDAAASTAGGHGQSPGLQRISKCLGWLTQRFRGAVAGGPWTFATSGCVGPTMRAQEHRRAIVGRARLHMVAEGALNGAVDHQGVGDVARVENARLLPDAQRSAGKLVSPPDLPSLEMLVKRSEASGPRRDGVRPASLPEWRAPFVKGRRLGIEALLGHHLGERRHRASDKGIPGPSTRAHVAITLWTACRASAKPPRPA